ncbi:hypothetical protein YPPY48_3050, partial [Yersinia pestis PY-48]
MARWWRSRFQLHRAYESFTTRLMMNGLI